MAFLRFKLFLGNVRSGQPYLVFPLVEVIMSNKGPKGRLLEGKKNTVPGQTALLAPDGESVPITPPTTSPAAYNPSILSSEVFIT